MNEQRARDREGDESKKERNNEREDGENGRGWTRNHHTILFIFSHLFSLSLSLFYTRLLKVFSLYIYFLKILIHPVFLLFILTLFSRTGCRSSRGHRSLKNLSTGSPLAKFQLSIHCNRVQFFSRLVRILYRSFFESSVNNDDNNFFFFISILSFHSHGCLDFTDVLTNIEFWHDDCLIEFVRNSTSPYLKFIR